MRDEPELRFVQIAGDLMPVATGSTAGGLFCTLRHCERARVLKRHPLDGSIGFGGSPAIGGSGFMLGADATSACVRILRTISPRITRAGLNDLAEIHQEYPIADILDHIAWRRPADHLHGARIARPYHH